MQLALFIVLTVIGILFIGAVGLSVGAFALIVGAWAVFWAIVAIWVVFWAAVWVLWWLIQPREAMETYSDELWRYEKARQEKAERKRLQKLAKAR